MKERRKETRSSEVKESVDTDQGSQRARKANGAEPVPSASAKRSPEEAGHKEQHVAKVGRPLAIIKADKMTASLDNEALALIVRDGFVGLRPQLEEWLPRAVELHSRFEGLKREKPRRTILGCHTWEQYCEEVLHYSDRHMRRLMEGTNPAEKYENKTKRRNDEKPLVAPAATSGQPNVGWSDDKFIKTCVRFVTSTLQTLESDSERFERVARAIAKEIVSAFNNDDEADWGGPDEPE